MDKSSTPNDSLKVPAEWTDDCQGKKDYDGHVVSISTRYWPRGGGISTFSRTEGWRDNPFTDQKPSAKCAVYFRHGDPYPRGDGFDLIEKEFEGETFEEVKAQVEAWAEQQYNRVLSALRKEFANG